MSPVAEMTSRERFLACLRGEEVDRPSVGNPTTLATREQMEATGAFFPKAHFQAEEMAVLAAAGHEMAGFDTILPYFSMYVEVATLGCRVNWGGPEAMPELLEHPLRGPEDFRLPADFLDRPPAREVLAAIRSLRARYGDRVALVAKVMGPWTLAFHLHGIQNFLMKLILQPEVARGFLEVLTPVSMRFAWAQLEAGADVVSWVDNATGDLVRPEAYRDFLLSVHRKVAEQVGAPVILHMCGDTADRLSYIAQSGFAAFHFDSKVDARRARELVGTAIRLVGNVNNAKTLLHGTPDDVAKEVQYALEAGVDIPAPECGVPLSTPLANLRAIVETACSFRRS